jgi:DNA-binding transcriptional LysR family regulator
MSLVHVYRVDLNLLPALDALLDERSVTRAARRVGVSQPAMSRSLARLRSLLKDDLLVRAGRSLVPTPQAQALRAQLHDGLERLEGALAEPGGFDPAKSTRAFHVATADYGTAVVVPRLLAQLAEQAPTIQLVVHPQAPGQDEALAEGQLDAIVSPRRGATPGLVWTKLLADEWVCLARRDHPSIEHTLSLAQFCDAGHVFVSPALDATSVVDAALARLGRTRRIVARVPSFLVAPVIVAHSALLAVVAGRLASVAARHDVRVLPLPLEVPGITVSLGWHERSRRDPAHQWFRRLLARVA